MPKISSIIINGINVSDSCSDQRTAELIRPLKGCGGSFAKSQGYRIDFKEIYFCFEFKKKIFNPFHKGWRGSVISIPMGNKR